MATTLEIYWRNNIYVYFGQFSVYIALWLSVLWLSSHKLTGVLKHNCGANGDHWGVFFWYLWQVMLTDMENSKKTLEEELQKTSEVSVSTRGHVPERHMEIFLRLNVRLSFPEGLRDRGGEHPAQEPSAGRRGRCGGAAGQQCRAGLRGGDPAAGSRDQRPEEPAGWQETCPRSGSGRRQGKCPSLCFVRCCHLVSHDLNLMFQLLWICIFLKKILTNLMSPPRCNNKCMKHANRSSQEGGEAC